MDLTKAAQEILTPLGFEVLEVVIGNRGRSRRVLLRVDRLDEKVVSIEDVRTAADAFGLELDRLDPFEGAYQLEVESPGAERPLFRARHFERFHDLRVKVRVTGETFIGVVRTVEGDTVAFELSADAPLRRIAIDQIERANLAQWPETPR